MNLKSLLINLVIASGLVVVNVQAGDKDNVEGNDTGYINFGGYSLDQMQAMQNDRPLNFKERLYIQRKMEREQREKEKEEAQNANLEDQQTQEQ